MAGGARKDPCPMLCPLAGFSLSAPQCPARGGARREGCGSSREELAPLVLEYLGSAVHSFPRAMPAFSCTAVCRASLPASFTRTGTMSVDSRDEAARGTSMQFPRQRAALPTRISSSESSRCIRTPSSMGRRRTGREAGRGTWWAQEGGGGRPAVSPARRIPTERAEAPRLLAGPLRGLRSPQHSAVPGTQARPRPGLSSLPPVLTPAFLSTSPAWAGGREPAPWTCGAGTRLHGEGPCSALGGPPPFPRGVKVSGSRPCPPDGSGLAIRQQLHWTPHHERSQVFPPGTEDPR